MSTIKITYIEQDEIEVKKAFDVLLVWYNWEVDTVLASMDQNEIAVTNSSLWSSLLSTTVAVFNAWNGNAVPYYLDNIVEYYGIKYRVINNHTSQVAWNPVDAPSLFALYRPVGITTIWVQPLGSTDAYKLDETVFHNDKTWISRNNANTWEPGTVAESIWEEVIA